MKGKLFEGGSVMTSYNLYQLLELLIAKSSEAAVKIEVSEKGIMIAGAVLAVIIGLFGYRLAKLFVGIVIGIVGFLSGLELFAYLQLHNSIVAHVPSWAAYVIGGIIAVVFMALCFSRFSYTLFALFALVGFNFMYSYFPDRMVLVVGGAIAIALLSALIVRFSFVTVTSFAGGFAAVKYVGTVLPDVGFLQLGMKNSALIVALVLSVLFFIFQYATRSRKHKELYG